MSLTIEDVEKIANLARLELTETEKRQYLAQLTAVLDYADRLNDLNLDDVVLRVECIGEREQSRPGYLPCHDLAKQAAPVSDNGVGHCNHICHFEGNVSVSLAVCHRSTARLFLSVLKNLQCRTLFSLARQSEMHAVDADIVHSCRSLKPVSAEMPFRGDRYAPEHVHIEGGKVPPVRSHEVGMHVACRHSTTTYPSIRLATIASRRASSK